MPEYIEIKLAVEGRNLVVQLIGSDAEGRTAILSSSSIPASSIAVAAGVMVDRSDDI